MQGRSVLKALDEVWAKFKVFVNNDENRMLLELLAVETRTQLDFLLDRDVLVILADVKTFFEDGRNKTAVLTKDETFLANFLPPEIHATKLSAETKAKLFLFARVASSLIKDLEKE